MVNNLKKQFVNTLNVSEGSWNLWRMKLRGLGSSALLLQNVHEGYLLIIVNKQEEFKLKAFKRGIVVVWALKTNW